MSTSLALTFPWGRYHATPWGRHVNEAAVEWPPSPWRLLRALYATWKARCPHLEAAIVEPLFVALGEPPSFVLPVAMTEGHTRHYLLAVDHLRDVKTSTDKAIDAFAVLERDAEVVVCWAIDLDATQRAVLSELAALLPYLGRAESVCSARLLAEGDELPGGQECRPLAGPAADLSMPAVRVLVATTPVDLDALTVRTTDVRRAGRLDPPGARWALYDPPMCAEPRLAARSSMATLPVTAVSWAVTGPARPSKYAAVAIAHVLRQACLSKYGKLFDGATSTVLAGKAEDGSKLTGHGHSHYLATDDDGDGLIDHLALWAPSGLEQGVLASLMQLVELTSRDYITDFRPVRLGIEAAGGADKVLSELSGPAKVWESITPFAPARYARRESWLEHLERSVRDELRWRDLPAPVDVAVVPGEWLRYRRHRPTNERLADARRATGLTIRFHEPMHGPLALGALSHFGLGLFRPVS